MDQPSLVTSALLATAITFPMLASVATALRFYAHRIMSKKSSLDDWILLLALVTSWIISVNTFVVAGMGGINKTWLDPITATATFQRALWIMAFPLCICLALVKISILLFYARIFTKRRFRMSVWCFIAILVGWMISAFFCGLFATNPISASWDPLNMHAFRFNYFQFSIVHPSMSLVFDIMVLCFPLPMIKDLHIKTRRKFIIAGIFWLGSFCCIAAAVRLWAQYIGVTKVQELDPHDRYKYQILNNIWCHIEPNCSIVAACLPTYAPFFTEARSPFSFVRHLRHKLSSHGGASRIPSTSYRSGSGMDGFVLANQGMACQSLKNIEHCDVITSKHADFEMELDDGKHAFDRVTMSSIFAADVEKVQQAFQTSNV